MLPKDPLLLDSYRQKLSEAQKNCFANCPMSEETKKKISITSILRGAKPPILKGDKHPNFGKTGEQSCHFKGYKYCVDCGKALSRRGRQYGRPDAIRCGSCSKKGERAPNWKGGLTTLYNQIRNLYQFRQWRSDVFTRDLFTCQDCLNPKSGYLEAHHIKSFSQIILENKIKNTDDALACDELWNINNGKTLCEDCHKKTHNYKGRNREILKKISSLIKGV